MKFKPYTGHIGHLPTNENYLNFRYCDPKCKILFSVCQQGEGAVRIHLASDKQGLRKLSNALNDWCDFVFWLFPWCEMIIGLIQRRSIRKLALKCGFKNTGIHRDINILVRERLCHF